MPAAINPKRFNLRRLWGIAIATPLLLVGGGMAFQHNVRTAKAQEVGRQIVVRSDIQEANQATGVMTARGNVRIDYPARQMQGTSAQAQYFSNEGVLILTGNAYVLQEGNSVRGEVITYYIDEGRAVATPRADRQVESVYYISDPDATTAPEKEPELTPYNPKPAFKEPFSDRPPENQPSTLAPPRVFQPVEEVTPNNGNFPPPPPIEEILSDSDR
ncbi:MAG: LptA/OstA family protein [Cyanobacteria bacterium P01_E01_bin.42]